MINYMEMGWSEKAAYEQYCQDQNIWYLRRLNDSYLVWSIII